MNPEWYKTIELDGISLAYRDQGMGTPVLFIHGFASFSYTWQQLIGHLPQQGFRYIALDCKGFGYSDKLCDDKLAPFDQSVLIAEFIRRLDLQDFVLVGHSLGGAIGLITLFNEGIRKRCKKIVLLDSAGLFQKLPEFIDDLTSLSASNSLLKLVNERLLAMLVLKQAYFDEEQITEETVIRYSDVLKQKGAKECLIAAAKQIAIANTKSFHEKVKGIKIPTLIVWGENDQIISVKDAFAFRDDMHDAELKIIPNCGHSPQEESPEITAQLLSDFLEDTQVSSAKVYHENDKEIVLCREGEVLDEIKKHTIPQKLHQWGKGKFPKSVHEVLEASGVYVRKLKMRRLIDRWNLETVILIVFVKILQFLKHLGFCAEENGWRKASGIFLRNEHSKFILTSFRLKYYGNDLATTNNEAPAKAILIERLADFLRQSPTCHWTLEHRFMQVRRKKVLFTDIFETKFDNGGCLVGLFPYFDSSRPGFELLSSELKRKALAKIIELFNQFRSVDEGKRAWRMQKKLASWVKRQRRIKYIVKQELLQFVERILNGTAIQFETLTDVPEKFTRDRFATPNMKKRMHPGSGLLNIVCRFTSDYHEADLWFQYHHVPVDGMPMQEMLEKLKQQWGEIGPIKYPALTSKAARPEVFYFGNRIFRARVYMNFDAMLKIRKYLNNKYYAEMGGPATVSSLIVWGLSQSLYFKNRKFLLPVDTSLIADSQHDRNISIFMIRPSKFFDTNNPLAGFLRFEREFNQRLFATRIGKSESYELLELYSMIHPLFYHIAGRWLKHGTGELLGTAGLTVIKSAEMFISPLTDLQFNGFAAIGNMQIPTEDGKTASAVSICGTRKRVKEYMTAIQNLTLHYADFLGISSEESG